MAVSENDHKWTLGAFIENQRELRAADQKLLEAYQKLNEQRFTDGDKAVRAALSDARTANDKAEKAVSERFAASNEIKGAMQDQTRQFITRGEVYALCAVAIAVGGLIGGTLGHFIR